MVMDDFTLRAYASLLDALSEHPIFGVSEWLKRQPSKGVLLRHDVDRKPGHALTVARLEAARGIHSTFYFRIVPCSFNETIIREVADLGHEIGYHYEDLAFARGDKAKAFESFKANLSRMNALTPVKSIAMHGSPLSPFDNRTLWEERGFEEFGVTSDAFLSVNYRGFYYFTDSGRTWGETSANLRDRVESLSVHGVSSTPDLVQFIEREDPALIAIVMHPERWTESTWAWGTQWAKDHLANSVKRVLRTARQLQ